MNVVEHLSATMDAYRLAYGEPKYRYFRRLIVWARERRKPGYHIRPMHDGDEVSREDFEAKFAESERLRSEAFMGRLPRNYYEYHRKLVGDGWKEHLTKDLEAIVARGI